MTRHERLLENYEDAYFALLMEDVAQMENARLDRFNTELQNDPHAAVPEELTKRCLKTINAHFSNMRRSSSLRIVKKAINLAAILIAISTLLFTSAFAISDEFRTATLNLVITANEKYTQLKMKQEDSPQESGNSMVTDNNEFFKNIRLAWLPDGYEYLSGEYDYQAIFANDENNWIVTLVKNPVVNRIPIFAFALLIDLKRGETEVRYIFWGLTECVSINLWVINLSNRIVNDSVLPGKPKRLRCGHGEFIPSDRRPIQHDFPWGVCAVFGLDVIILRLLLLRFRVT